MAFLQILMRIRPFFLQIWMRIRHFFFKYGSGSDLFLIRIRIRNPARSKRRTNSVVKDNFMVIQNSQEVMSIDLLNETSGKHCTCHAVYFLYQYWQTHTWNDANLVLCLKLMQFHRRPFSIRKTINDHFTPRRIFSIDTFFTEHYHQSPSSIWNLKKIFFVSFSGFYGF